MKTLILTVGLPRSGKSTWARAQGLPMVNPDSLRLAIHGQRYVPEAESLVWALTKLMVRALFLAGHDTVILDATNTIAARRKEWHSDEWRVKYQIVATTEAECLARAEAANDAEIIPVIKRMAASFEPVTIDEMYEAEG